MATAGAFLIANIGTIASVAAAATAVGSAVQQRKAGKEQRRQNEISNRIAATRRVRGIKQAIAAARIRRAEAQSAGFQFGVASGTASQGAAAGVVGDLATSIGAANQQFTGQQVIAESQDRVSALQQSAATFGTVSSIAGSTSQQDVETIQSLFA